MAKSDKEVLLDEIKVQNEEQFKTSMEDFKKTLTDEYKAAITEALKDGVKPDTIKVLNDALDAIAEKTKGLDVTILDALKTEMQKVNDELAKVGLAIKGIKENPQVTAQKPKGIGTLAKEAIIAAGYVKEEKLRDGTIIKGVNFGQSKSFAPFELKAAIDMTTALSMTIGSTPGVNLGYVTDYGMAQVQINLTKDTHLMQGVIPVMPTQDKYVGIFVEYTYEDGVDTAAEDSAVGKSSLLFKTVEFKVHDIGTYFHISVNQFDDLDSLEARLNRIAPDKILSKIDSKALGTNITDASDIQGLCGVGNFTAFDPSTWTSEVQDANEIDVISKQKLQAELDDEDVNIAILHPSTVSRMQDYKDADNNNLRDRRLTFDGNGNLVRVCGLAIVKNKNITANESIVMWNEASEFGLRKDVEMTIGLENDDLTTRMRTVLFICRVAHGIAKPSAIIYSDDLTADKAVLLKV